jgi:hypothetical protein
MDPVTIALTGLLAKKLLESASSKAGRVLGRRSAASPTRCGATLATTMT